jgi:hypothetical protein
MYVKMPKTARWTTRLVVALLLVLIGCRPAWQATIVQPDGDAFMVNREILETLDGFREDLNGREVVPLERVLLTAGHWSVERLVLIAVDVVDGVDGVDGARREFGWADVAEDAWWMDDGHLSIGGEELLVSRVEVIPSLLLDRVEARIIDLAPTAAAALGLPAPGQATGRVLEPSSARHVLLLFLDGFGYVRYTEALADGLIPYLASLGEPIVGLTAYPPTTNVASASMLTGALPEVHGADRRGIRTVETETLLDVAAAVGLQVVAIEGEALAFNLRNAEMQLSGDRDGNGSTDDNVLANALAALEKGMPDLFFVHFHGIDDAGHEYGPGAPQERSKIREVDAAVERLVGAVPSDTLVIIFADHGMHAVNELGRLGNHGHLIERDMFIPIFVMVKGGDI